MKRFLIAVVASLAIAGAASAQQSPGQLSRQAGPPDQSVSARRYVRQPGAPARGEAAHGARPAGGHREQAGRHVLARRGLRRAAARADGYTLLLGPMTAFTVLPHLRKLPYDPVTSFEPISTVATYLAVVTVRNDMPVRSVRRPGGAGAQATRQAQLRLVGRGVVRQHGRRNHQAAPVDRHAARAVQGLERSRAGTARRPHRPVHRRRRPRRGQVRQGARARSVRRPAAPRTARRADDRRGRSEGRIAERLVGAVRAQGHAGADREAARDPRWRGSSPTPT